MSELISYLLEGFRHITDITAYDHMLFLVALCAMYRPEAWRKVLILVTAFTIGHSLTLAISTLNRPLIPTEIIEFLIPVTILITALGNVFQKEDEISPSRMRMNYGIAGLFGLIHGMGFSNHLRERLQAQLEANRRGAAFFGSDRNQGGEVAESIWQELLAFNIGVELGQIVIVLIIMGIAYLLLGPCKVKHREWNLFVSGAAAGVAFILMTQTKFW